MNETEKYSIEWDKSGKYIYEKGYYQWMCERVKQYSRLLELGCGTGYSTLSLLNSGHSVIAVDKNHFCLSKARDLIKSHLSHLSVDFIEGDIVEKEVQECLVEKQFDAVICWNIGTEWNPEKMPFYVQQMISYGLSVEQIRQNPESSYSELILWHACRIAKGKNVPIHIIERMLEYAKKGSRSDQYYDLLRREIGYKTITYDNYLADSLSSAGRSLTVSGIKQDDEVIQINYASILLE